jgi:hypothetical protein
MLHITAMIVNGIQEGTMPISPPNLSTISTHDATPGHLLKVKRDSGAIWAIRGRECTIPLFALHNEKAFYSWAPEDKSLALDFGMDWRLDIDPDGATFCLPKDRINVGIIVVFGESKFIRCIVNSNVAAHFNLDTYIMQQISLDEAVRSQEKANEAYFTSWKLTFGITGTDQRQTLLEWSLPKE